MQGSIAGQREATRVSGCVSEGKSRTGRYPMRGLPAEEGLPTHLYLAMGGSDARGKSEEHEGNWASCPGSTKHKAGRPANSEGVVSTEMRRAPKTRRKPGYTRPDRERKQTKFP